MDITTGFLEREREDDITANSKFDFSGQIVLMALTILMLI